MDHPFGITGEFVAHFVTAKEARPIVTGTKLEVLLRAAEQSIVDIAVNPDLVG
jgi:hypothetical protein